MGLYHRIDLQQDGWSVAEWVRKTRKNKPDLKISFEVE
jgi:hypothetical protein